MTLTINELISSIKQHLSIIGKRLRGKDGKSQFSDVTLGTGEDTLILTQYVEAAVQDVEGVLKKLITPPETAAESGKIAINIKNERGDSDFEDRAKDMIVSYITLNYVGEYLSMVYPEIAQKYYRDAQQRIEMLVAYVFYKKPPVEKLEMTQPTVRWDGKAKDEEPEESNP